MINNIFNLYMNHFKEFYNLNYFPTCYMHQNLYCAIWGGKQKNMSNKSMIQAIIFYFL